MFEKLTAASIDLVDNLAFLQWAHVVEDIAGEGDVDPEVTETEPPKDNETEPVAAEEVIEEDEQVEEATEDSAETTQDENVDSGDASGRLLQETVELVDESSEPATFDSEEEEPLIEEGQADQSAPDSSTETTIEDGQEDALDQPSSQGTEELTEES